MNIINFDEISMPQLKTSMLDFAHANCDSELIQILLSSIVCQSNKFATIQEILRNVYYMPENVLEPEFEQSIDGKLYLNIVPDIIYGYRFTLAKFADNNEIMADVQIELSQEEFELVEPLIGKYFDNEFDENILNQIRIETVQTMRTSVPKEISNKLKLVSDSIIGHRYRSAWISYDNKKCICCELSDYTNKKCPIIMNEFGF